MRKKLAKAAAVAGMMVMVALSVAGCGKVECDFCGEMKKCKTETIFGEDIHYCSDCEKEIQELFQ